LLAAAAVEPASPEPFLLDFSQVEVATASFLRESILIFRDSIRAQKSNFYPVVANASEPVLEELMVLIRAGGGVLMSCRLRHNGEITDGKLIGQLEPKQRMTFELVQLHGETDAAELMREYGGGEGTTRTTAWNNRLSALASLGLIVEVAHGRARRYKPLIEERIDGV
jgi:hypothetical protein